MDRIGGIIDQNQNLARSRNGVDIDLAKNHALGRRYENISWADDLVYLRNRSGPKSHCSHGLCSTDAKNSIDPGKVRRSEKNGAVSAEGRSHDNLIDSRHFGGNRIHEHG